LLRVAIARPVVDDTDSRSVTLTEGDDVQLQCTGWGWPVPHVTWTRQGDSSRVYGLNEFGVTLGDVVTSHNVTLRHASLSIKNVNRTDQLDYVCTVANSLGYNNRTIFLRVKGPNRHTLCDVSQ